MNILSQLGNPPLTQKNPIESLGGTITAKTYGGRMINPSLPSESSPQIISARDQTNTNNETSLTSIIDLLKELLTTLDSVMNQNKNKATPTLHATKLIDQNALLRIKTPENLVPQVVLPSDKEKSVQETYLSAKKNGEKPDDIWGGLFFSPVDTLYLSRSHSSHVAGIKLAMQKFGQSPNDIYKEVTKLENGFNITMRDNFKLHITFKELELAKEGCRMLGEEGMLTDAAFLFGTLVKRKQIESHDPSAAQSFAITMMQTNNGESAKTVLELLGLKEHVKRVPSQDIATTRGLGIITKNPSESLAIIDGLADFHCTPSGVRKYQEAYILT